MLIDGMSASKGSQIMVSGLCSTCGEYLVCDVRGEFVAQRDRFR